MWWMALIAIWWWWWFIWKFQKAINAHEDTTYVWHYLHWTYRKNLCKTATLKKNTNWFSRPNYRLMQDKSIAECSNGEHSAILSTFIKLPFVIKIFVLPIFERPFYTGLTVYTHLPDWPSDSYSGISATIREDSPELSEADPNSSNSESRMCAQRMSLWDCLFGHLLVASAITTKIPCTGSINLNGLASH